MHPAYSVIFFSSATGAGYGLFLWLASTHLFGITRIEPHIGLGAGVAGLILITFGLLSSTFHLGRPERAWRAFSQWRTSWLSREGVAAVLSYPFLTCFTAGFWLEGLPASIVTVAAVGTILTSVATVACTGMIYASLKPIPRWHNAWVVPAYLALAIASGGLIFLVAAAVSDGADKMLLMEALLAVLLAWSIKWGYWTWIDKRQGTSTSGTATGLGHFGEVRQLEAPHTSDNFVLQEMGYTIARKHAIRLRKIALRMGAMVPAILMIFGTIPTGIIQVGMLSFGMLCGLVGVLIERWLFFAEAQHAVTLFYGEGRV